LDKEDRLSSEHPQALRLWLRLLTCTQLIETTVRSQLRSEFNTSLARFDLMAQLEKSPDGMGMKALSQRLMVTSGNVTGLTDQLVAEGLVERHTVPNDRRATRVCLTTKGRREFKTMAKAHETWIVKAFDQLGEKKSQQLYELLGEVKQQQKTP
jgi:DNA-binding MarR family transcriptional regulator